MILSRVGTSFSDSLFVFYDSKNPLIRIKFNRKLRRISPSEAKNGKKRKLWIKINQNRINFNHTGPSLPQTMGLVELKHN
ncbi:hypothetical protein CH359_08565 [Leptospira meyeri]|nr:hypothetical protein CH359_08565 [Leptospira meyeri]PJZ96633.1 hypothetical protein CH358_10235 [Leptospira meyeri]